MIGVPLTIANSYIRQIYKYAVEQNETISLFMSKITPWQIKQYALVHDVHKIRYRYFQKHANSVRYSHNLYKRTVAKSEATIDCTP